MVSSAMSKVIIAHSQRLFGEALGAALGSFPNVEVVQSYPISGSDAVKLALRHKPDVAVMDYWLADVEGPAVAAMLRARLPACKCFLLGWLCTSAQHRMASDAGAHAVLDSDINPGQLADAIGSVAAAEPDGCKIFTPDSYMAGRRGSSDDQQWTRLGSLSPREIEVLQSLADGGKVGEVALRLGITAGTLENHIHKIHTKLGVSSHSQAVTLARRYGFLAVQRLEKGSRKSSTRSNSLKAPLDQKIRILVGDAEPLFSLSLAQALAAETDLDVLAVHPRSAREALVAIETLRPEVALLDHWMDGIQDEIEDWAASAGPSRTKVVLLSWMHSAAHVRQALLAQVSGFLPKSVSLSRVIDAVRWARAGEDLVGGLRLAEMLEELERRREVWADAAHRCYGMTVRELEVLKLLSAGRDLADVARDLAMSRGTVKVHIRSILKKTGTRSHPEAVALAHRALLIQQYQDFTAIGNAS